MPAKGVAPALPPRRRPLWSDLVEYVHPKRYFRSVFKSTPQPEAIVEADDHKTAIVRAINRTIDVRPINRTIEVRSIDRDGPMVRK